MSQFENQLTAMFDAAPALDDAHAFAAAVEARLDRTLQWRARLTAAAAVVGGAGALWGLSAWTARGFDLDLLSRLATGWDPATVWVAMGLALLAILAAPAVSGVEV